MARRLESDQRKSADPRRFQKLSGYVLGEDSPGPYAQAAIDLGITVSAVKVAVHRLRHEFGKWLRIEASCTLADPSETDDEVRHIIRLIESSRTGLEGLSP